MPSGSPVRACLRRSSTCSGRGRCSASRFTPTPRIVMAVMRPDFFWPIITARPGALPGPELWVPGGPGDIPRPATNEDADMTANRTAGYLRAIARLKPGVTVEQARAEMASIGDRLSREHVDDGGRSATVTTIRDQFYGPV